MPEFDPTALSEIADILDESGFVARAKHARAALAEIERLRADVDNLNAALAGSEKTIIIDSSTQAKRIAKLQDALVEERAKICRIALPCEENCECGKTRPHADWKDCPNRAKWQQIARERLCQEGLL